MWSIMQFNKLRKHQNTLSFIQKLTKVKRKTLLHDFLLKTFASAGYWTNINYMILYYLFWKYGHFSYISTTISNSWMCNKCTVKNQTP